MPDPKRIGILAGMGQHSTAPFVQMVVDECHRQYTPTYEEEFPHMLIYSLPAPFRWDDSVDHDALQAVICGGLRRLEAGGVDFIAMPCNTAHMYYEALVACIDIPLLNMIDIAVEKALPLAGKATIIGTYFTLEAQLYQSRLAKTGAILVQQWQDEVEALIQSIHAADPASMDRWQAFTAKLADDGVGTAIIACTDLNVVSDKLDTPFTRVDATYALAEATVKHWLAL